MTLPYAPEELEPVISRETIEFHYGKHLQAYVDNLNKLIAGTEYEQMTLEEIVCKADGGIFNNAGQIQNHNLYFGQFAPMEESRVRNQESRLATLSIIKAIIRDFGILSFNGNKMITTSGGGALICKDTAAKQKIMWLATQAREAYPYYQHEAIGFNYRLSNICAGIGRGQMTVLNDHLAHHKHIADLYREAFAKIDEITFHDAPSADYDANYWLCTALLDENVHIREEELAYAEAIQGAVGGAAGVVHGGGSVHTDCEPNRNVEALRIQLDKAGIESRPLWKPMHKQPVFKNSPAYVNGNSEALFKRGICLPSGPMVTDEDAAYIIENIKKAII